MATAPVAAAATGAEQERPQEVQGGCFKRGQARSGELREFQTSIATDLGLAQALTRYLDRANRLQICWSLDRSAPTISRAFYCLSFLHISTPALLLLAGQK